MKVPQLFIEVPALGYATLIVLALLVGALICFIFQTVLPALRARHTRKTQKAQALARYEQIVEVSALLQQDLAALIEQNINPMTILVQFFSLTSPVADQMDETYDMQAFLDKDQLYKLRSLREIFQCMGRSPYGINRTKPGEPVDSSKVYLGGIWGIFTDSISEWNRAQSAGELTGLHKNTYATLQGFAKQFMKNNVTAFGQVLSGTVSA